MIHITGSPPIDPSQCRTNLFKSNSPSSWHGWINFPKPLSRTSTETQTPTTPLSLLKNLDWPSLYLQKHSSISTLQKDFFKAKLHPAEKLIEMSDYHFVEGMKYDAHPIHFWTFNIRGSTHNSFAETELARIQSKLAHLTHPLDTLAVMAAKDHSQNIWKDRAVALASTIRYLAGGHHSPSKQVSSKHPLPTNGSGRSYVPNSLRLLLPTSPREKQPWTPSMPVFPAKKKHNRPPNKDQDKHDSTKSGNSNGKYPGTSPRTTRTKALATPQQQQQEQQEGQL